MSERQAYYNAKTKRVGSCYYWVCEQCGRELCVVTDGEAWFKTVDGDIVILGKWARDRVKCQRCGHWNEWRG